MIRFLLPFPHPVIPLELLGSRRNESMYVHIWIFISYSAHYLLCNLWQCTELPNSKSNSTLLRWNWNNASMEPGEAQLQDDSIQPSIAGQTTTFALHCRQLSLKVEFCWLKKQVAKEMDLSTVSSWWKHSSRGYHYPDCFPFQCCLDCYY